MEILTDGESSAIKRIPAEIQHFACVEESRQWSIRQSSTFLQLQNCNASSRTVQWNSYSLRIPFKNIYINYYEYSIRLLNFQLINNTMEPVTLCWKSIIQASEILQMSLPGHNGSMQMTKLGNPA